MSSVPKDRAACKASAVDHLETGIALHQAPRRRLSRPRVSALDNQAHREVSKGLRKMMLLYHTKLPPPE